MGHRYPKRSQLKYTKQRYRVRNWREYEAGLKKRGDLTLWFSEEAIAAWRVPPGEKPGGQTIYSDLAIEAGSTVRVRSRNRNVVIKRPRDDYKSVAHPVAHDVVLAL